MGDIMKTKKFNPPVAVDLFSGSGGLSLGLKQAGFQVKAAVEIDSVAINTYTKNLDNVVLHNDIRSISGKELMEKANIQCGDLFLLAGCPPCQGFSSQRRDKSKELDPRNELVFEYVRLINETNPGFILMENVPGMSRGFGKKIFEEAKNQLEKNYYIVYDILNAANYGVPQTRRRLVLHGIRLDLYERFFRSNNSLKFDLPSNTHTNPRNKLKGINLNLEDWNTVRVIQDLPIICAGEEFNSDTIFNHKAQNLSDLNIERMKHIRCNGGNRTCLPENLQLNCHKIHTGHNDVYGIMEWDKPSPTITGGCLSYSKGRYGHPEQDRAISAREAARLQSFPDDYQFVGPLNKIALQIGNAVPVKLAKASGDILKKCFEIVLKEN
jgi:DNA (cytosine-5)-methyltransferase 1